MYGNDFPRVEGYTIRRVIGSGGFSTVYEATQDDIGSTVALKVLNVSIHDETGIRRLDREYRSMGRLRDQPGIVPVYTTTSTSEGRAVIVMAYMPGGSLHDRIRQQGRLPADDIARIASELGTALGAAHALGIHHRDIKPENVLFDARGNAALSDFGLAAIEGMSDASTTAASLSPPHSPPERFLGEPVVDLVASDVYSLASTLATCATGRPPFGTSKDGGIAALILRITSAAPPDLEGADLPPALVGAIAAGLAKDPSERPSLTELIAATESTATPPTPIVAPPAIDPDATIVVGASPAIDRTRSLASPTVVAASTVAVHTSKTKPFEKPKRNRATWLVPAIGLSVTLAACGIAYATIGGPRSQSQATGSAIVDQPQSSNDFQALVLGGARVLPVPNDALSGLEVGAIQQFLEVSVDCRTDTATETWLRMVDGPRAGFYVAATSVLPRVAGSEGDLPAC